MILPAIDEFLIGKEIGNYSLDLESKKAFGERRKDLIKVMPLSLFNNQKAMPEKGMVFSFDNLLGKITAVSGGRVIVDFNNPLAGKSVVYELTVKRILDDKSEKIKALMLAFFSKEFPFKLEDNNLTIEAEKNSGGFIELFKPKFKEILDLDFGIKEKAEEKKSAEEKRKNKST
jgi:FKBP-type peptidyl-prolyl cis-trans isomerase 2